MAKYVCAICGFIYDEEEGNIEAELSPGTQWSNVHNTFKCPLCGASKDDFYLGKESDNKQESTAVNNTIILPDETNYSSIELSAIFSNLAKGCEKQYKPKMAEMYSQLSDYYSSSIQDDCNNYKDILSLLDNDLESSYQVANSIATNYNDRGALRALKWSEQVSRMINSHITKALTDPEFIKDSNIYVCDICGFIYIGDQKPDICPICKVPNTKITQIKREV